MKGRSGNPQKGSKVLCRISHVKYELIKQNNHQFKASTMCEVFGVNRNKYYKWLQNPVTERKSSKGWLPNTTVIDLFSRMTVMSKREFYAIELEICHFLA